MLTIIVPTKDRPEFVARLLKYYSGRRFRHWIFLGDSGEEASAEKNLNSINKLGKTLKVKHFKFPGLNISQCINSLSEEVTTPYSVLLGDDDLLVPRGLEECMDFLNKHTEYAAANGAATLFSLKQPGPYGDMDGVASYPQPEINEEAGAKRLVKFFGNYAVTLFSVHRTEIWRKMWEKTDQIKDNNFASELLPCALSAVLGKVASMPVLYLMRQVHDQRFHHKDVYDWLTGPEWFPAYKMFERILAESLSQKDNLSAEEAREKVKHAFWAYLDKVLIRKFQEQYDKGSSAGVRAHIKAAIKRLPGVADYLLQAWYLVKSNIFWFCSTEISLPVLLNPSSPYHADFMPIYRAITNQPQGKEHDE